LSAPGRSRQLPLQKAALPPTVKLGNCTIQRL
jgi:hypothetical protein